MSSCCWMRIKKHLFLHGNRNKKLCWSVICLVNCCFWKEISQLKIFLLTNILTQRLKHLLMIFFFFLFFFFFRKTGSGKFWQNSPWAPAKIAILHHKNKALNCFFAFMIINNICQRNSIFNFCDNKIFFRQI